MRKTSRTGSFFLVLMLNILLNFRLTIPGWILLILSFIIPQYIRWWYAMIYFGAFLLYILIWMLVLRAVGAWVRTADPAPTIPNKNPYSSTGYRPIGEQKNLNPYSVKGYESMKQSGDQDEN